MRQSFIALGLTLLTAPIALAVDIEGVQPASLDQPRVHIHLRREANGKPLSTGKGGEKTINVQAFLDTGASGILLSKQTADALGIQRATAAGGQNVIFSDVGVAGGDTFNVSEPLHVFIAPFGKNGEPDDADGYPISVGPVRAQVGPLAAGLIEMLTGGLDVVGMPAIKGRVIVIDPKPVDTFGDTLRSGLFDPKAARQGKSVIPKTDRHVQVSYGSFARFTSTTPAGATEPTMADNPFIGPSPTLAPTAAGADATPPIVIGMNGKESSGSWLLDTGAAASMISVKQAEKIGVKYVEGTEGTASPKLSGVPEHRQFTLTVGGIGGSKKSAGFFIDTLTLPTQEKDPIVYRKAPVLVADITVVDPKTKQSITLDGVFGMNFLVASAFVSDDGLLPDLGEMSAGAFDWIVFDEPAKTLGLALKKEFQAKPSQIEIRPAKPAQKRK